MMRHTIYMLLCCLCTFTVAMAQASQRYKRQGEYKDDFTPRFSTGPVVGTDIYIFSCIALQVEYSYRLALASYYHATYTDNRQGNPTTYHGQPHRHVFSMGLKVDFPFHFTEGDKRGLIQELLDLY